MLILFAFLILYLGMFMGFCLRWWLEKDKSYGGTIVVSKDKDKLIYSLELIDDPEKLQYNDRILFKIDSSRMSLDRE